MFKIFEFIKKINLKFKFFLGVLILSKIKELFKKNIISKETTKFLLQKIGLSKKLANHLINIKNEPK